MRPVQKTIILESSSRRYYKLKHSFSPNHVTPIFSIDIAFNNIALILINVSFSFSLS